MSNVTQTIREGWEAILRLDIPEAERLFLKATQDDPDVADGWNGIGAVHFENAELELSLKSYERALKMVTKDAGGKLPDRLAWNDEGKPALRAIHGIGLNRFRTGDFDGAIKSFTLLLKCNPEDNQGAHFLLQDAKKKKLLWKK